VIVFASRWPEREGAGRIGDHDRRPGVVADESADGLPMVGVLADEVHDQCEGRSSSAAKKGLICR